MDDGLVGKSFYAFGDTIVYGRTYANSFADLVAEQEDMTLTEFARNGAPIGAAPHAYGGQIRTQIEQAAAVEPDFFILDGGTNDRAKPVPAIPCWGQRRPRSWAARHPQEG